MSLSARIRNIILATGFTLVALVGVAVQPAAASAAPAAPVAAQSADAGISTTCWYEYTFYRSGSTLYASSFKDCVFYDVPQPISFSVQALVGDEWGGSYWVTWAKGSGNIITPCPSWTMVRHSITKETLICP